MWQYGIKFFQLLFTTIQLQWINTDGSMEKKILYWVKFLFSLSVLKTDNVFENNCLHQIIRWDHVRNYKICTCTKKVSLLWGNGDVITLDIFFVCQIKILVHLEEHLRGKAIALPIVKATNIISNISWKYWVIVYYSKHTQ